jgi:hypothetical protein
VGLLLLAVLLIFILENGQRAKVSFFGDHTHLPQGVALLPAAVIGGLFVVLRVPHGFSSCGAEPKEGFRTSRAGQRDASRKVRKDDTMSPGSRHRLAEDFRA